MFLFLCRSLYVETFNIHTIILQLICDPVCSEGGCCSSLVKFLSVSRTLLRKIMMRKKTTTAHLHP